MAAANSSEPQATPRLHASPERALRRSAPEIFVPGRLCLFGEHSDWAAEHRRANSELCKGFTIVVGTNQGLYARVETHPRALVIRSTMPDGEVRTSQEIPMEPKALLAEAEAGGFFSYAAGDMGWEGGGVTGRRFCAARRPQ